MKEKALFLYVWLILLTVPANSQQIQFAFKYITNDNGLTYNTVYDICQDNKGYMWFATEIGLNRYDGHNVKQYRFSPDDIHSLPSRSVPCLLYTSDSTLFVGTIDGLAVYSPMTDNFNRIVYQGESFGHFTSMHQGFGTELLISTENKGSFIFDYAEHTFFPFEVDEQLFGFAAGHDTYWAFSRFTLYRFNRQRELIARYPVSPDLFASSISYIKYDKQGRLLVGTFENGVFIFHPQTNEFQQLPVCRKAKMYYIRSIEDGNKDGEYWIGTENGLYIINDQTDEYEHYTQSFDSRRKTINDNAIYKIYRNRQGIFFIGTYFGGVNITNTREVGFNAVQPYDKPGNLHGKAISSMAKAPDGNIWIATEDAGIAIFDKQNYTFRHLLFDAKDPLSISSNNVHTLLMDGRYCWVGHFMGSVSKVDIATGKAKRFSQAMNSPATLDNNFVFALHFFSPDSILVGSLSGVDLLDKRTEKFSPFRENEFAGAFIYDIFTAPDGKIWFCSYDRGIFVLDKTKLGLMERFQMGDGSGLTSNSIISYCIDSKQQVWIGTRDGGLLKFIPEEERFESCKPEMLVGNVIYGIVEDEDGFLWISTNKGISRLNFSDATALHFSIKHGLAGNQHNYKSYFKDDGIIYFGSVTGFTWFNPKTIVIPQETPSVYFTGLRIFNEVIHPDSTGVLRQQIDFTKQLALKHNQNSFTFDFASINYFADDIAYQYYLEGFENAWSPPVNRAQANYTNIAPGDYVFHIRAVNMINNAVSAERTLLITIDPPFWASGYAYLLYFIIMGGIAYYFYRTYKNRQREKMALAIEKIEKENLKTLHQHKLNFFTYISHEFKTPLSIISASAEMLVEKTDDEGNGMLQSIKRSAGRLLFLVNQLMEFRKIETDHAVIQITKGNIIAFSNQIIHTYRPLLEKKNIELNINANYIKTELPFDFDKLEKIITNLLTNAIKYTPQNGNINLGISIDNRYIRLSVKDSGGGMSEKKKNKIFEVFYSDSFSNDVVESSGIGLALTASLVKLLKGTITVDSAPGKGSRFNVELPYEENPALASEEKQGSDAVVSTGLLLNGAESDKEDVPALKDEKEYTLVIAEDNKDLLMLLQKKFKDRYHVKCFKNGEEAWEYINKKIPDILITDIMMPIMSGIELCERVKTDVNLCHIPVVMLTAKDTKEAKLEGLLVGADAYIAKPFSMAELEIRLSNILNNQKALKNRLKELASFEGFDIPATNHEQAFVEKMLAVIQNNLEKSELDMQFIADELNISRSNLHNKMKSLMKMSTTEFINTVRINRAKELMQQDEEITFAEIAYQVGYNDSAYFTRVFKKLNGKTPKEHRQGLRKIQH
jgi:signal transduction histidine kinase/ligand-binding sensor domain-containing protein/DNA-binding response OmpR family regulator